MFINHHYFRTNSYWPAPKQYAYILYYDLMAMQSIALLCLNANLCHEDGDDNDTYVKKC